jgi:cell shape-determining protein MreC
MLPPQALLDQMLESRRLKHENERLKLENKELKDAIKSMAENVNEEDVDE